MLNKGLISGESAPNADVVQKFSHVWRVWNWKVSIKLEPNWHKLGPVNGFSHGMLAQGLNLEWILFHIFHRWYNYHYHLYRQCIVDSGHRDDTQEKCFLHVNYTLKRFLVDQTWRCTWKLSLDKGLTNADIEEIVTSISPKPQSWRYISFSTTERSPKWNSTQEKSPCEHCVKIV